MEIQELKVERRTKSGKGIARKLRASGFLPAICYRKGIEPIPLSVNRKAFETLLGAAEGQNLLIKLTAEGADGREDLETAIVKDLQKGALTGLLHIDFLGVHMDQAITVEITLVVEGEPVEAIRAGGVIQQLKHAVEVECLPAEMPDRISVDVSGLELGQSIQAGELELPKGIRLLTDGKEPVVVISLPEAEKEEEVSEEEEAAAAEGAEGAEGAGNEDKKEE